MRQRFVQNHFDKDAPGLPSGYMHLGHHLLMRDALEFVRDNRLDYRLKIPSFSGLITDAPIMATMKFETWTAFAVCRRVLWTTKPTIHYAAGNARRPRTVGSDWVTYVCFSREEDRLMFKIGWPGGN